MTTFAGIAAIVLGLAAAALGYSLHDRYRAAIEYKGIGRPYPIGNSLLAFQGMALMLFGIIVAGIVAMVTFV